MNKLRKLDLGVLEILRTGPQLTGMTARELSATLGQSVGKILPAIDKVAGLGFLEARRDRELFPSEGGMSSVRQPGEDCKRYYRLTAAGRAALLSARTS